MQQDLDKTVFIEHCTNCKSHKWCTYHNEEKYHDFFAKGTLDVYLLKIHFILVKNVILNEYPDFVIVGNQPQNNGSFVHSRDSSLNTTKGYFYSNINKNKELR